MVFDSNIQNIALGVFVGVFFGAPFVHWYVQTCERWIEGESVKPRDLKNWIKIYSCLVNYIFYDFHCPILQPISIKCYKRYIMILIF